MQAHGLSFLLAFFLSIVCSLANPITTEISPLIQRSRHCANAPNVVAGTYFARRSLPQEGLESRAPSGLEPAIIWCAENSETFVMLTASARIPGNSVQVLLTQAFAEVISWIHTKGGNGFLTNGEFLMDGPNAVTIRVWNTNNHQLTVATLGAAVSALYNYMQAKNFFGAATFYIWDGPHEIGAGLIGLTS